MQITTTVKAHMLESRPIEVIESTSELWSVEGPLVRPMIAARILEWTEKRTFVWLDPPVGVRGEVVESVLLEARIPVRFKPRLVGDVVVAEELVRTPAEISQTMREVVADLANEVGASLLKGDMQYLIETLDSAMSGAGL
jgi:hypothetical protein